jgi:hypothetical protein
MVGQKAPEIGNSYVIPIASMPFITFGQYGINPFNRPNFSSSETKSRGLCQLKEILN